MAFGFIIMPRGICQEPYILIIVLPKPSFLPGQVIIGLLSGLAIVGAIGQILKVIIIEVMFEVIIMALFRYLTV